MGLLHDIERTLPPNLVIVREARLSLNLLLPKVRSLKKRMKDALTMLPTVVEAQAMADDIFREQEFTFDDIKWRLNLVFDTNGFNPIACRTLVAMIELGEHKSDEFNGFLEAAKNELDQLLAVESNANNALRPNVVLAVDPVAEDGLDRSKLEFAWFGSRYEWLTETMMDALEVLFKAHQQQRRVKPDEMENRIGNLPDGGFFKVFEVDRTGWEKVHPVRKIVGGRANSGWYLIEQNSSQT